MLRRADEVRVCGSFGHCTGLFGSQFQGPSLLTGALLPSPIPLCPFIQRPSVSRRLSSPPRRSSGVLHPCPSRASDLPGRLARSCANRYVPIFCRFYFGEHLVAGMRTKGTCSLRKSSRRRQEGGSRTRLGLFTCS